MPMKFALMSSIAGVVAFGWFTVDARAAPQVLALISTEGEVQLACNGGECAATFSSFCLQNERSSPPSGTAYQLASADDVRVTALDRQGRKISLDAMRVLKLTAMRTQVAVRISVAESRLADLGVSQVSVDVGDSVTLLPVPRVGDSDPLREDEIAVAKSTLRQAGSRIVDGDGVRTMTVRWLAGLANALPEDRTAEAGVRREVVQAAVTGPAMTSMTTEARDLAEYALAGCEMDLQLQIFKSLRSCLESAHDAHLWNLNADYWQAVQTGS